MTMEKIKLESPPKTNIQDGLLCLFESDTKTEKDYALCDIIEGQLTYEYPEDSRKIKAIYIKI